MSAPAYGDVLICTATLDDEMVPGRIVTVAHATENYLYFKEVPNVGYRRGQNFPLGVRRPWWAWGDEAAWEREAKKSAANALRDLLNDGFRWRRYQEQRALDGFTTAPRAHAERIEPGHLTPQPPARSRRAASEALAALAYLSLRDI